MSHYGTEKYLSMIHTSQKFLPFHIKNDERFFKVFVYITVFANKPDE